MDDNALVNPRKRRSSIHFILVRTQFASNLGTSVRALKNMGFENLVLIGPECEVGVEARARSMKGDYILDQARFFPSLQAAQKEIPLLAGATGRYSGRGRKKPLEARAFACDFLTRLSDVPLGLVFGPEDNGLSRRELQLCQYLITIPGGSDFPVMNLSQAVAVVAYEMNLALRDAEKPGRAGRQNENGQDGNLREPDQQESPASSHEIKTLLQALERRLGKEDLPHYWSRGRLMHRLRGLAARSRLQSEDVNMLLSLLKEPDQENSE